MESRFNFIYDMKAKGALLGGGREGEERREEEEHGTEIEKNFRFLSFAKIHI